jgi:hypothetical protein
MLPTSSSHVDGDTYGDDMDSEDSSLNSLCVGCLLPLEHVWLSLGNLVQC